MSSIIQLPIELIKQICSYASPRCILNLSFTCKTVMKDISSDQYNYLLDGIKFYHNYPLLKNTIRAIELNLSNINNIDYDAVCEGMETLHLNYSLESCLYLAGFDFDKLFPNIKNVIMGKSTMHHLKGSTNINSNSIIVKNKCNIYNFPLINERLLETLDEQPHLHKMIKTCHASLDTYDEVIKRGYEIDTLFIMTTIYVDIVDISKYKARKLLFTSRCANMLGLSGENEHVQEIEMKSQEPIMFLKNCKLPNVRKMIAIKLDSERSLSTVIPKIKKMTINMNPSFLDLRKCKHLQDVNFTYILGNKYRELQLPTSCRYLTLYVQDQKFLNFSSVDIRKLSQLTINFKNAIDFDISSGNRNVKLPKVHVNYIKKVKLKKINNGTKTTIRLKKQYK